MTFSYELPFYQLPRLFLQTLSAVYDKISEIEIFPYIKAVMFESSTLWTVFHLNIRNDDESVRQFDVANRVSRDVFCYLSLKKVFSVEVLLISN